MIQPKNDGTREDIYRRAVANFQQQFSQLDAVEAIAQKLRKNSKTVYGYLSGAVIPPVDVEEELFRICLYPRGFDEKKNLVFKLSVEVGK